MSSQILLTDAKTLKLFDLPTNALEMIVEWAELKEQLKKSEPNIKNLLIQPDLDHIFIRFDKTSVIYSTPNHKRFTEEIAKHHNYNYELHEDFQKKFIEDMKIILKNPNLKICELNLDSNLMDEKSIEMAKNFYEELEQLMKSLDHRIHVETIHLKIFNQENALSILPYLQPKILKHIEMSNDLPHDMDNLAVFPIEKITKLDQWKGAEQVRLDTFKIQEPFEDFSHFQQFQAEWDNMTLEMLTKLKMGLAKSANFKSCTIEVANKIETEDVKAVFGEEVDERVSKYSIPKSDNDLKLVHCTNGMIIIENPQKIPPHLIDTTDPRVIRTLIFYDARAEKKVWEGYKSLLKIDPDFKYPEYEYWYYRFLAGNLDLSDDRSADAKPLNLEELPEDILNKILEPVIVKARLELRDVSQKMRSVVDKHKTNYDDFYILCLQDSVEASVLDGHSSWEKRWSKEKDGGNFMAIALRDLGIILESIEIRIEHLEIRKNYEIDDSYHLKQIVDLLVSFFKKNNSKFDVKTAKIIIHESNLALPLLSVLQPGVLENLVVGCTSDDELIDMNRIKNMEQIKQAKTLDLWEFAVTQSTDVAFFLNFDEFVVSVHSMGPEDVARLRDDLSKPDNSTFRKCIFFLQTPFENMDDIAKALGKDVKIRYHEVKHSFAIANSEKFLHFTIAENQIWVEKGDSTLDDSDDGFVLAADDSVGESDDE